MNHLADMLHVSLKPSDQFLRTDDGQFVHGTTDRYVQRLIIHLATGINDDHEMDPPIPPKVALCEPDLPKS